MFDRSYRRHESERLKASRKKYSGASFSTAETPKPCSCYLCGNRRKWFNEQTIQEQKMFQRGAY